MNHLVVGEGEHVVLGEGVEHAEGQLTVVVGAMHWLFAQVVQRVMHPAHVPLEAEPQTAESGGARDHGPCGGLFGDALGVRVSEIDCLVALAEEIDGLQVLTPAVLVGYPLARLAGVVQVEHRGDGIDPQAVGVIVIKPEAGVADEKAAHFVAAVVVDGAAPLRVQALAGQGVLVEVSAVKVAEAVLVRWGNGRAPSPG